ncbi:hypothetical protein D3C76_1862390 [compost metagenome]
MRFPNDFYLNIRYHFFDFGNYLKHVNQDQITITALWTIHYDVQQLVFDLRLSQHMRNILKLNR